MGEKYASLPSTAEHIPPPVEGTTNRSRVFRRLSIFTALSCILFLSAKYWLPVSGFEGCKHLFRAPKYVKHDKNLCPQFDVLTPEKNRLVWEALGNTYGTEEFKLRAVDWLAGAVKVP